MSKIADRLNPSQPWNTDFPATVTEADIYYCFRLLLGRRPNKLEWPSHSWRIGENLDSVVSSYLTSQEFTNRHLSARPLGNLELMELPQFKIYASREDTFLGKVIAETHDYEPHVGKIFKQYLRPGMKVLDIGANIGYFSLLAACLVGAAGAVYSWEPSPVNVRTLYASQLVNKFSNIEIMQAAATDGTILLKYFRNLSNGNVAEVQHASAEDVLASETVMGLRIDDFVSPHAHIDFVKIDVEGYEFKALTGARRTLERSKPILVTEFSPASLPAASGVSGREYLEFLAQLDYDIFVITEAKPASASIDQVLSRFDDSGSDHLDLLLQPKSSRSL
ncbi:MAG: FkbM family methyltransferase [Candidatus Korobacteraceae bacterium]